MIKKDDAKKMALKLGMADEAFETAWTAEEEVEITIPEAVVFTPDELATRDTNLIEPIKTKHYNEGKTNGVEMIVKEQREALGLQFEGKTVDNLLTSFKEKTLADAKLEPNARIQELEGDKTLLQSTIDDLKAEHETKISGLTGKITEQSINAVIESAVLDGAPEGLNSSDIRLMIKSKYTFETVDGKITAKLNGEIVKDDKANPKPIEALMQEFYDDRGWKKAAGGGRGGKDEFGTGSNAIADFKKIQSIDDLNTYCKQHNLQPQSDTILNMMAKHMTEDQKKKALRA